jgi:hypothetical protein
MVQVVWFLSRQETVFIAFEWFEPFIEYGNVIAFGKIEGLIL